MVQDHERSGTYRPIKWVSGPLAASRRRVAARRARANARTTERKRGGYGPEQRLWSRVVQWMRQLETLSQVA